MAGETVTRIIGIEAERAKRINQISETALDFLSCTMVAKDNLTPDEYADVTMKIVRAARELIPCTLPLGMMELWQQYLQCLLDSYKVAIQEAWRKRQEAAENPPTPVM